jgi:subtilisin family serine protease
MRGGQFVTPDPLPPRDVTFVPSAIGAGVKVLVIDTAYVESPPLKPVIHAVPFAPLVGAELPRAAGHGTFVTGQILRVAPGATIVGPSGTLDNEGMTNDYELAKALDASLPEQPHLVNLSLGGYTRDDRLPGILKDALGRLKAGGAVIIAAAGNNDAARTWFPAGEDPLAVAVGAVVRVGSSWARAAYSNFGPWVDFVAPGLVNGPFLTWGGQPQPYDGWAGWSGTSFSAPLVTGAVAALMTMQETKDPAAAVRKLWDNSPPAPAGDFANAKVVNPPVLWS